MDKTLAVQFRDAVSKPANPVSIRDLWSLVRDNADEILRALEVCAAVDAKQGTLRCVYCAKDIGPGGPIPMDEMDEHFRVHIHGCLTHPLSTAYARIAALEQERDAATSRADQIEVDAVKAHAALEAENAELIRWRDTVLAVLKEGE